MQELLDKRNAWISPVPDENFYVHLPGGIWTKQMKHVVSDQAICYARAHVARFCATYDWPRQSGFAYNKFAGEENANKLAQGWQERGHHFFEIWMAESHGDTNFRFTPEELTSHTHSKEWLDWALAVYSNDTVWAAVQKVVHAQPTNPA